MECKEILEKMSDYLDNQLTQEEAEQFEQHMKNCPECQKEFYEFEKIILKLKTIEDIEPPAYLKDVIMEKIKLGNKKNNIISFRKYSYVAAIALIFVGGAYILKVNKDINTEKENYISMIASQDSQQAPESVEANITDTEEIAPLINEAENLESENPKDNLTADNLYEKNENDLEKSNGENINNDNSTNNENPETIDEINNQSNTLTDNSINHNAEATQEHPFIANGRMMEEKNEGVIYEKKIEKSDANNYFSYHIVLGKEEVCIVTFDNTSNKDVNIYFENAIGDIIGEENLAEKKVLNNIEFLAPEDALEEDVYAINIQAKNNDYIEGYLKIEVKKR